MTCTIKFNEEGNIKTVLTPKGVESRLFKQIARLPHVSSLEEALEVFKNVYSQGMQKKEISQPELEEPTLTFKSDTGSVFQTYKEALTNSTGGLIEIGIETGKGFQNFMSVSSNTNESTFNGFINSFIKDGILSDEKIIEDGKTFHKAEGNDPALQMVNERLIKESAVTNLNSKNITLHTDGRIELRDAVNSIEVNGEIVSISEIRNSTLEELTKRFGKDVALQMTINNAVKEALPGGTKVEPLTVSEKDLSLKLLDLLNGMGVKVMSIQNYIEAYKIRNGVEPSAGALADIANQVVAFKDGILAPELLTEETCHFIVEAWDNVEIENLLRNINKTEAYQEHSEHYREIYTRENPSMSEEEVENLVRREVLGKELAKSLKTRFSTEGKTEMQTNILRRIYDMFVKFFNGLNISDDYKRDLENLTLKVEDLLLSQDINKYLNLEQTKSKKFRMYQSGQSSGNAMLDSKATVAKLLVQVLLDQEKTLIRAGVGSTAEVQRLNDALDKALTKSSGLELIKLAKRYAVYLSGAIRDAQKRGETLSNEEGIVLYNLKENIAPVLERLKVLVREDPELSSLEEDIKNVLDEISNVKGEVANTENNILNRIVDRLMVRHNIDDKYRDDLIKGIENATKDTQLLYSWFGQITHAHDPLLNILGSVISDMNLDAEHKYMSRVKKWQQKIRELGFLEKDLAKFSEGNGYVVSLYDWEKFEKEVLKTRATLYKQYSGSQESIEQISKKLEDGTIAPITDKDAEFEYKNAVTKEINTFIERSFTDEYYEGREKEYDDLGISKNTRTFLKLLSTDLGQLMARVKTEKGLPRYKYQDQHNLDGINLRRRTAKSLHDELGGLKKGIIEVSMPEDGVTIESSGKFYKLDTRLSPDAREEATLAFEINKIDKTFIDKKNAEAALSGGDKIDVEKLAPKFLEELDRIEKEEGREAAVEFFLLNTSLGFSSEFWNGFDTSETMMTYIDSYAQGANAEQTWIDEIEKYKSQLEERKAILKRYQDSKNYTNTLASEIPTEVKEHILRLSEDIDRSYNLLYTLFKDVAQVGEEKEATTESTPNQAYYEALQDNRRNTTEEKLDFNYKNMTPENRKKVRNFSDILDDFASGRHVSDKQKELIKKISGINELSQILPSDIDGLKLKYSESKLAPYYRAFSPIGVSDFYKNLKSGTQSVTDLVTTLNERADVKISNNFSYYEMGEIKFKNENYKSDFEGGSRQPKLSKFLNPKFVEMFAPKLDSNNNPILKDGKIQPTRNQKMFDLYTEYMEFQKESLRSYGELGLQNLYLAPQISKTRLQKIQGLLQGKKGVLKDMWLDATRFRVDEQAFGAEFQGESLIKKANIRIIPKYFLKKLEASTDVSEDLFNTSALFAQQAELYRAKKERFSEFAVLNDKVMNRVYPDGKAAEATNTYKMFKSYMDYNLFGVKELKQWRVNLPFLGQVDLTKIVNWLHNWVKNNSLALNVVVPLTSWITAETTLFLEKLIGQYVDKGSMAMANREFLKISTPAINEGLDINSKAKLSVMGEYYGAFDLNARFENSMYNKGIRTLSKSMYILHTAANFVPLSKAMLSQLYGHRVFGDKLVDFKKFEELQKLSDPNITMDSIKSNWEKLKDKTLYSYVDIKDNSVTYNYDKLAQDMGKTNGEEFQKEFRNMELGVVSKVKKLIERIDGQIKNEERTQLQRHVLGGFTMTHKAWLSIGTSNRFKRKHLNMQTGQFEEGSYLSVMKTFTNTINKGVASKSFMGAMTELKNMYKNADETERENIRRVLIESSFMTALFLLTLSISGWADDDDDSMLAQATAYMFERTANETSSSQFGILGEFYSSSKEPIVGLSKIENLASVKNLFDTSLVDRGRYAGLTNQETYLVKNLVGAKSFFDLYSAKNLKSQRDAYNHFNNSESFVPIAMFINKESLEEYDKESNNEE